MINNNKIMITEYKMFIPANTLKLDILYVNRLSLQMKQSYDMHGSPNKQS